MDLITTNENLESIIIIIAKSKKLYKKTVENP